MEHQGEVKQLSTGGFQAVCGGCGWLGHPFNEIEGAVKNLDDHYRGEI